MEAAKEPTKDPAPSRPAASRGDSRKRSRPGGLRSRNKAQQAARQALRIVALGGGTGLSALLQGLKLHTFRGNGGASPVDLSAIVTVSDDGGSSGRLRRAFDILAPGDIRNCMVALAEDEALLAQLFQYRFSNGKGLEGHSFGNLFLTALTNVTGDFHQAIQLSSEVLAIRGRNLPFHARQRQARSAASKRPLTDRGDPHQRFPRANQVDPAKAEALRAAAGVTRGHRAGGCHYTRTGVALYQRHSQSAGRRRLRRHCAVQGRQDLHLQLDVATGRNGRLHCGRSCPGDT